MEALLNMIAPMALIIFVVGIGLRFRRWFKVALIGGKVRSITEQFEGGPRPASVWEALTQVIINPITHFFFRANRAWSRGYTLYHMAIMTEATGYSLAALILLFHIVMGHPIPDVSRHVAESHNYSPANLLAIVFGNGEHLQAHFLFGDMATVFVLFTWIAVMFAVAGNLNMLMTVLQKRNGAVLEDIDSAARGMRIAGRMTWDRLAVRFLIFTIIWTELLARLEIVPGIVYLHALLGVTLLALLPFTYLFHMVYNFLAIFYATRRRMQRTIA